MSVGYPKECKKAVHRIMFATGISEDIAYSMLLMTAALMDLRPEDDRTIEIVLEDCGVFPNHPS